MYRKAIFANQYDDMIKHSTLLLLGVILVLASCKQKNQTPGPDNAFVKTLKEQAVGNSGFLVSLPENYSVRQKGGADFKVYYFAPADSTLTALFTAGIYLGNFPTEFSPASDSCKTATTREKLLGKNAEWKIFSCDSSFFVQAIVDNKYSEGWNSKLHAFGKGSVAADKEKVFTILSTLRHP